MFSVLMLQSHHVTGARKRHSSYVLENLRVFRLEADCKDLTKEGKILSNAIVVVCVSSQDREIYNFE